MSAAYYSSRASCSAISLTAVQAWDRFLKVYKDTIRFLKPAHFALQADACDKEFADPATDFRVFGIKVFKDLICVKYQPQM
jgi:hypothetical protein